MTIAEQIYAIVKELPPDQANEILAFAESVRSQHSIRVDDQAIPWTDLVNSLAGAWANDFPTLEEIRAGEGQDNLQEQSPAKSACALG